MKARSNTLGANHRYCLNREKFHQIKAEIISSTIKASNVLFSHKHTFEDSDRKKQRILSLNKIVSQVPSSLYKNYYSGGNRNFLASIVQVRKTSFLKRITKWPIECQAPKSVSNVKYLNNFSTIREGVICRTCEEDREHRPRLFKRRK